MRRWREMNRGADPPKADKCRSCETANGPGRLGTCATSNGRRAWVRPPYRTTDGKGPAGVRVSR